MLTSVENVHYINILTIRHLGKWTLLLVENVEVKLTHTHIYAHKCKQRNGIQMS